MGTMADTASPAALPLWVVYENAADLPGVFCARKWLLDKPTGEMRQHKTLEGLRELLPRGLYRLPRNPGDEPHIVEVWI